MTLEQLVKSKIRDVPDFPKPGILFKDITPLLQDSNSFHQVIHYFVNRYQNQKIDAVLGIESRGFIFGAPLAYKLGTSFVPIRKEGKLPHKTINHSYTLEYGEAVIEMHVDAIRRGDRVVIVDDLLATGGTAEAACHLVEKLGGVVVECAFVVELGLLKGREKIKNRDIVSLVCY